MLALGLHLKHILHMRQYVFAPILFLEFDIGVRAYKRFLKYLGFTAVFSFSCSSEDKSLMVLKDPLFLRPPPPCQPPVNRTKCLE